MNPYKSINQQSSFKGFRKQKKRKVIQLVAALIYTVGTDCEVRSGATKNCVAYYFDMQICRKKTVKQMNTGGGG